MFAGWLSSSSVISGAGTVGKLEAQSKMPQPVVCFWGCQPHFDVSREKDCTQGLGSNGIGEGGAMEKLWSVSS